jgi:N-carbamoyl-L-amino-acid hydrolase
MQEDRLWQDLMALAEITDPDKPYTRRCFTDRFLEGRRWLERRFTDAGLTTRLDAGGNLIGRLEGSGPTLKTLMIGSHSDTVPSGGRFDGPLGVLAGLEVVRMLGDNRIRLRHPLEIVDFLSEEPSNYGPSCIGSRAMTGFLDASMLTLCNSAGESLAAAMIRMGAEPERLTGPLRDDVAAFLELHIEQARVLEDCNLDIGLVIAIVGIARVEIEFTGSAAHAGTTPYPLRRDALVAAADLITRVRKLGEHFARNLNGYFIATTGRIEVLPNASNVVPGLARLTVEARAEQAAQLDAFLQELAQASLAAAAAAGVERSAFKRISRSEPSPSDQRLLEHFGAAADYLSLKTIRMASGAGHDAAFVGQIAPMAMIFVPSHEGKSHCSEEWTESKQCASGARMLYEAVLRIDKDPEFDVTG